MRIMVKVLIVNFPPQGLDVPPIGIASLFANIKNVSETDIFDFNINLFYENFFSEKEWNFSEHKFWESKECAAMLCKSNSYSQLENMLKKKDYDIICFSINEHGKNLLNFTLDCLFKTFKMERKLIIVGGPFCSKTDIMRLQKSLFVDLFVIGEGELVLQNIIKRYKLKGNINRLRGIEISAAGNKFLVANKINKLDILKDPDYSQFNLKMYKFRDSIPIYFSRGCNYNCCFCRDKPIWGRNVWRNPKRIVAEMLALKDTYKIKVFYGVDLDILSNPSRLEELCKLITKKKLNVIWRQQGRVNKWVTIEMLNLMHQAGCESICLGLESGSPRICKDMGKETPKDVEKFMRMAHNVGINVSIAVIVGYPTETWLDFSKTLFFLLKNFRYITRIVAINTFHIPSESIMSSRLNQYSVIFSDGEWKRGKNTVKIRKIRYEIANFIANKTFWANRYI